MSTDVSLAQLCAERRTLQLTRVAPNRLEIDSPYNKINSTYTKFDYDMRRKAEVLKYASNKSSSQTNSLSKREKYARMLDSSVTWHACACVSECASTCESVVR